MNEMMFREYARTTRRSSVQRRNSRCIFSLKRLTRRQAGENETEDRGVIVLKADMKTD